MATIMVGSARQDERRKFASGEAGDQTQGSLTYDTKGEVAIERMYNHSLGWYVLRPKSVEHANAIAKKMLDACNNPNIGYDQYNRLGVVKYGINTKTKTECDCSTLARECVKEATGKDPGNFTTWNEVAVLSATGLFEDYFPYVSQTKTPLFNGDILVTRSKGHTVIVVSGNSRYKTPSATPSKVTATKAAKKHNKKLTGVYKTTSKLHLRNGAGINHKSLVVIPKDTTVRNYGYFSKSAGTKWLYIQFTLNGITYTGFCSEKYLEKI